MTLPVRYQRVEVTPEQLQAKLAELGQPLDEQELELAWVTASYVIGSRCGDRRGLGPIVRILGAMVTTPAPEEDGGRPLLEGLVPTRWPYPEARGGITRAWSWGKQVVDRLELSADELDELWKEAKLGSSTRPKLPLWLVLAYFPPPMLAALAAVIRLGALDAGLLLERCLLLMSLGKVQIGERKGKPLASESLEQYETNFRTLALVLSEQVYRSFRFPDEQRNAPPRSALAGWYVMPPLLDHKLFRAPNAGLDRTAPPHLALRRGIAAVRQRLRLPLRSYGGLQRVSQALAVEFFVELGGREAAVAQITKESLIEHHPLFGGPAVMLAAMKGREARGPSAKPIRPELYALARHYIGWSGLDKLPPRPIWISGWGPGGIGDPLPARNADAICQQLRRAVKRALGGKPPHTVRHAISQYAAAATRDYVEANKHSDPRLGRISEQVGARALLDQAFDKLDELGYGDLEADREKFSLVAWRGICRAVYGEEGLRRAPDWVRIERARGELEAAGRAQRAAAERLAALQQERRTLELQEDDVEPEEDEDVAPGPDDLTGSLSELAQQLRDLRRENREERRRRRELTRLTHACDEARLALEAADRQLRLADAELKLASETWIGVADSLDDDAYEALCANPPRWQSVESERAAPAVRRGWVTSKELARVSGRSEATIRNYMSGRTLSPWWDAADRERIVQGRGRLRTVAVFEIEEQRLAPIMWQRLLALCAEPPPPWYASVDPTLPAAPPAAPLSFAETEPPAEAGGALAA